MAVTLTVSETLDGTAVADALSGGGTGVDLGSVVNGSYAPINVGGPADNSGRQDIYIRHDAVDDPITDVKTFIQAYGVGTGFTYGGATGSTPASDLTLLLDTWGNTTDKTSPAKNNLNGTSKGLWIDMDADVAQANQFDYFTNGTGEGGNDTVDIYGDGGGAAGGRGSDLATAIVMKADAMVYDAAGESIPSAPADGIIGLQTGGGAGETAAEAGDNAHCGLRILVPDSHPDGGIVQWEWVIAYSFTS